jgi:hypothetical protein
MSVDPDAIAQARAARARAPPAPRSGRSPCLGSSSAAPTRRANAPPRRGAPLLRRLARQLGSGGAHLQPGGKGVSSRAMGPDDPLAWAAGDDDAVACAERALARVAAIDDTTGLAEIESRVDDLVSALVRSNGDTTSAKVGLSVMVRGARALLALLKTLEKHGADGCLNLQLRAAFGARWLTQFVNGGDLPEALALLILVTERALGNVAKAANSLLQDEDGTEDMGIFLADIEETSFSRMKEMIKLGKKFVRRLSCSHVALDDLGLAQSTNSARFLEHATGYVQPRTAVCSGAACA